MGRVIMGGGQVDCCNILRLVKDGVVSSSISIRDLGTLNCEISKMYCGELSRLINSIEQWQIKGYMFGRGSKLEMTRPGLLIWLAGDIQVLTPTDKSYRDYYSCLYTAFERIAEIDGNDISDVVDSILKFKPGGKS